MVVSFFGLAALLHAPLSVCLGRKRFAGSFFSFAALVIAFRAHGARTALPRQCRARRRTRCRSGAGLTRRSSGPATACHQGPVGGTRYIFANRALASRRRGPLSSNYKGFPICQAARIPKVNRASTSPMRHSSFVFVRIRLGIALASIASKGCGLEELQTVIDAVVYRTADPDERRARGLHSLVESAFRH